MNARLAEIKIAILEDKKKAGILAALALVALVVGIRATTKGSPERASASSPALTTTPQAGGPITLPAIDPAKLANSTRRYAKADELARDPFALDPQAFPSADGPKSGSAASEDQQSLPQSLPTAADRAAESLSRMRVRSVIIGPRPVAVIEWRADTAARSYTLAVGDDIDGFTVTSITRREITLTRNDSSFSLAFDPSSK